MKDRKISRANKMKSQELEIQKSIKRNEEALDRKTVGGVSDLTPFQAIENIRRNDIDRTS